MNTQGNQALPSQTCIRVGMFFQALLWPSERRFHCPFYVKLLFRDMFYLLTSWAMPGCAHRVMVVIEPWVPEISTAVCAKVVPWKTVKLKNGKRSVRGKGASNWQRKQYLNMRKQACLLERLAFSLFIFEMTWNGNNSDSRQRWCCFSKRNYSLKPAVIQKRFIDFTLARHVLNCVYMKCARTVMAGSAATTEKKISYFSPDLSKPQVALFPNPNSDMSCNCTWSVHVWTWHTRASTFLGWFTSMKFKRPVELKLLISWCQIDVQRGGGGDGLPKGRIECNSCWTCSW